ncbi:MAG: hypothetical protein OEO21_09970 [Candidatus Krumholzibacteria bacterium]|nr:hypothetical protein [Candidatus Krumholzibacteria bacterium]
MTRTPVRAFTLCALAVLLAGCSSQLKRPSDVEPSYLLALRAEYLAAYPDGAHNEYVQRGEVVQGMDILAVLASWGHPVRRSKEGVHTEKWIYREEDEASKDWIEYTFVFRDNVLDAWELARHVSEGRTVQLEGPNKTDTLTRGAFTTGKRVPKD